MATTYTYYTLPVGNDLPWYTFTISLSQILYTIHMRFNTRMNRWIMDLADGQNNILVAGVPLLIGVNLIGRFVIPGLPPGYFFVTDDTGQNTQPTRNSFGTTHSLFYGDPLKA